MEHDEIYARAAAFAAKYSSTAPRLDNLGIERLSKLERALSLSASLQCPYFHAIDLLAYPELVQLLRTTPDYFTLSREYALESADLKGAPLLSALAAELPIHYAAFAEEHRALSSDLDTQIKRLLLRREPIKVEAVDCWSITVSGVEYKQATDRHDSCAALDGFKTHALFAIDQTYDGPWRVLIEEFIPGTPLVGVRVRPDQDHRGRVTWYNIETRQPASARERRDARTMAA